MSTYSSPAQQELEPNQQHQYETKQRSVGAYSGEQCITYCCAVSFLSDFVHSGLKSLE